MTMHHDPNAHLKAMTHLAAEECKILRVLEADWRRMSGNPMGQDPGFGHQRDLDAALPHAFVLRRVGPGVARFRVAGQKLHHLIRMDPRGMPFSAFFNEGSRETVMEMVEAAFTLPAIAAIPLTAKPGFGRKPVRATALLMPMRDSDGDLTRMMGAIVASNPIPRKTHQFDVDHTVEMRCETLDGAFPDRRTGPRTWTQQPTPSKITKLPQRAHLRLVVDNA